METRDLSAEAIRQRLRRRRPSPMQEVYPPGFFAAPPDPAAVLLPLFAKEGQWNLLFIRRADRESDYHGGQVAFPGGRREPLDPTPEATALREAEEEIGLSPKDVRLLGSLRPYRTVSNFLVTPVVGVIPWPLRLQPDVAEVSRIFSIPLVWLQSPGHRHIRDRSLEPEGPSFPVVYYQRYDGEQLWGVTARIALGLLEAIGE